MFSKYQTTHDKCGFIVQMGMAAPVSTKRGYLDVMEAGTYLVTSLEIHKQWLYWYWPSTSEFGQFSLFLGLCVHFLGMIPFSHQYNSIG